jgi:hypothetical protein
LAFFAVDLDTTAVSFNNPGADVKAKPVRSLPRSPDLPFYEGLEEISHDVWQAEHLDSMM